MGIFAIFLIVLFVRKRKDQNKEPEKPPVKEFYKKNYSKFVGELSKLLSQRNTTTPPPGSYPSPITPNPQILRDLYADLGSDICGSPLTVTGSDTELWLSLLYKDWVPNLILASNISLDKKKDYLAAYWTYIIFFLATLDPTAGMDVNPFTTTKNSNNEPVVILSEKATSTGPDYLIPYRKPQLTIPEFFELCYLTFTNDEKIKASLNEIKQNGIGNFCNDIRTTLQNKSYLIPPSSSYSSSRY